MLRFSLALALLLTALPFGGCATNIADRVTRAAQRGAEDAAAREAYNRANRAVSNTIECVVGDRDCTERAEREGRTVVLTDNNGNPLPDDQQPNRVGTADANYNFTPGERTLFSETFASANAGDFPRSLYYMSGTMEVVSVDGRKMLRATSGGVFQIQLPERVPERFTLQFDLQRAGDSNVSIYTRPPHRDDDNRPFSGYDGDYINAGSWRGSGLWSDGEPRSVLFTERDILVPVEITVDGEALKMYVDRVRVANVPRVDLGRHNAITFWINSREDRPLFLGNLRVAAGGNDLYSQLQSEGSLTLGGVEFETASSTLRSASTQILDGVAQMLLQHPEVRLRVEGHTDNTGTAAGNERLSQQRAESVRDFLVGRGIASDRLVPMGMGQNQPIASNDTEDGRQRNRRVVLVQL
ncbi:MAG: OmpA family protein [Bacteroidota bacterium]